MGQRIEVFSKGKWYRAKSIDADGDQLLVHYCGLDDSYDEWVGPERVRPYRPAQFGEGDKVDVLWESDGKWYPATVVTRLVRPAPGPVRRLRRVERRVGRPGADQAAGKVSGRGSAGPRPRIAGNFARLRTSHARPPTSHHKHLAGIVFRATREVVADVGVHLGFGGIPTPDALSSQARSAAGSKSNAAKSA